LCGYTASEKLPKITLFGPSLILQLRLLGSQQNPQSGVLITSFSTWGTENSLEINLESTGVIKGCNIFWGSKIGKHLQLCGWAHYHAKRKKSLEQKSSFRIRRTTVLGMFKDSAIILDIIRWSFFTKSSATAAMFTSV
jgi:hypothetical protein